MKSFFQHDSDDRDYYKETEDESEKSQEDEPFASCPHPSDKPEKSEDDREYYKETEKFQEDDEESFTEVRGKHSTEWNKFGRPPHYFSKKRKRSCGIQNPFLEDDTEYYSESENVQQDDSSGASLARPVGSTNAKSVNKKASIE